VTITYCPALASSHANREIHSLHPSGETITVTSSAVLDPHTRASSATSAVNVVSPVGSSRGDLPEEVDEASGVPCARMCSITFAALYMPLVNFNPVAESQ
jgi:hypothetical protein